MIPPFVMEPPYLTDAQGARRDTSSPGGQRCPPFILPDPCNLTGGVCNLMKRTAKIKPMAGKNYNPRRANGTLRNKHRARLRALGLPCAICGGAIHYGEPSDSAHPLSFVVDEKLPVSRWKEFGYSSAKEAAQDWNNLQPAHYICNATKSNKTAGEMARRMNKIEKKTISWLPDGSW